MKILQINCVYKKGSTGKIVYDLHSELLAEGYDSIVCYGRGSKMNEKYVYKTCGEIYSHINKVCTWFTGIMYGGCKLSTIKLIKVIEKERPDIVHLHCINGYFVNIYNLIKYLRNNSIKTVLTLHAEFMFTGGCGHSFDCNQWKSESGCGKPACPRWRKETGSLFFDRTSSMWKKMKDAFDDFDDLRVVSVSPWLMKRAKESTILGNKKHFTVLNGLNTSIFHYIQDSEKLRNNLGLSNAKVVFHVTPYFSIDKSHIKGGWYVLEMAKRLSGDNIKFVIAGAYDSNLNEADYRNVKFLGPVRNQHLLASIYSLADATLLTSRRETFSMVTSESLCCGTPIVGFFAGGPEIIAIDNFSEFVDYGDCDKLEEKIIKVLKTNYNKREISLKAYAKYSNKIMCKNYLGIYNDLLKM